MINNNTRVRRVPSSLAWHTFDQCLYRVAQNESSLVRATAATIRYNNGFNQNVPAAGIPVVIIDVLVRWNYAVSDPFVAESGVRQGSRLSPAMFNVSINVLILELKTLRIDC